MFTTAGARIILRCRPWTCRVLAEPDAAVRLLLPLVGGGIRGKSKKWDGMTFEPLAPAPPTQSDGHRAITNDDLASCLAELREGRKFTLTRVPIGWASNRYHFREPLDYLGTDGGGGLGSGPGMAVGVGLALRGTDRIAITVIGDGDFTRNGALDRGALSHPGPGDRRQ
jgi:Thiamine pyrophosphate enzyme, C-terminal TPP binding domain